MFLDLSTGTFEYIFADDSSVSQRLRVWYCMFHVLWVITLIMEKLFRQSLEVMQIFLQISIITLNKIPAKVFVGIFLQFLWNVCLFY